MNTRFAAFRKARRLAVFGLAALTLAACEPIALPDLGGGTAGGGPRINPNQPVQVALLLPKSDASTGAIPAALENAVRLAMAETSAARIDLRVYDTAGSASTAAAQAQRAVDEGARIVIGPLRQDAVNAAGLAVADEGINVLGFSNNPTIAGGNVFILGNTFDNVADRLMGYARRQGKQSIGVLYAGDGDAAGDLSRRAIEKAAVANGLKVAPFAYPLSIEGVSAAAQSAGRVAQSGGIDAVVITSDAASGVTPTLLDLLPGAGAAPGATQYIGLSRWDVKPELFDLRGAEGAWFAVPDQSARESFASRYRAAYGTGPHPLAGVAYDAMSAVTTLVAAGRNDALTGKALTRANGFAGSNGVFRIMPDGTNRRALAIATVRNKQVVILDAAPSSLSGAGS